MQTLSVIQVFPTSASKAGMTGLRGKSMKKQRSYHFNQKCALQEKLLKTILFQVNNKILIQTGWFSFGLFLSTFPFFARMLFMTQMKQKSINIYIDTNNYQSPQIQTPSILHFNMKMIQKFKLQAEKQENYLVTACQQMVFKYSQDTATTQTINQSSYLMQLNLKNAVKYFRELKDYKKIVQLCLTVLKELSKLKNSESSILFRQCKGQAMQYVKYVSVQYLLSFGDNILSFITSKEERTMFIQYLLHRTHKNMSLLQKYPALTTKTKAYYQQLLQMHKQSPKKCNVFWQEMFSMLKWGHFSMPILLQLYEKYINRFDYVALMELYLRQFQKAKERYALIDNQKDKMELGDLIVWTEFKDVEKLERYVYSQQALTQWKSSMLQMLLESLKREICHQLQDQAQEKQIQGAQPEDFELL